MKLGLMWVAPTPPDILLTLARNAESEGVEYLAVHDHLEPYCRDVFVNMTYLLTHTESATVGTNVVNPYTMHPVNCARAVAHLEEIAPGRTFLGWAPGHLIGIPSLGIPYEKPLARTREAVRLSKQLLSGTIPPHLGPPIPDEYQVDFRGEFFQFTDNYVLPSRKVPVSVASGAPKMLEMGAEEADGVYVGHYGRREAAQWCLDHVNIGAERAGKTLDDLTIYQGFWFSVWPERNVALDAVARLASVGAIVSLPFRKRFDIKMPFESYIGEATKPGTDAFNTWAGQTTYKAKPEFLAQIPEEVRRWMAIAGTPDECVQQLREAIDPRADVVYIIFFAPQPWAVDGDPWREPYLEMGRLFNREVLPELKKILAEYTALRNGGGRSSVDNQSLSANS